MEEAVSSRWIVVGARAVVADDGVVVRRALRRYRLVIGGLRRAAEIRPTRQCRHPRAARSQCLAKPRRLDGGLWLLLGRTRKRAATDRHADPDDCFPGKRLPGARDLLRVRRSSPLMSPGRAGVDACYHANSQAAVLSRCVCRAPMIATPRNHGAVLTLCLPCGLQLASSPTLAYLVRHHQRGAAMPEFHAREGACARTSDAQARQEQVCPLRRAERSGVLVRSTGWGGSAGQRQPSEVGAGDWGDA
jgi:hypothetical protein